MAFRKNESSGSPSQAEYGGPRSLNFVIFCVLSWLKENGQTEVHLRQVKDLGYIE